MTKDGRSTVRKGPGERGLSVSADWRTSRPGRMLSRMTVKLQIALLRVADLGFPEGALTREIVGSDSDRDLFGHPAPFTGGKRRELGLELCPPNLAPHLCLEYADQPAGERLHVAMKPITSSDGEPRIFVVAHGANGLSLDAVRAKSDDHWAPDDVFVFCLGRKPEFQEQT
jgi:hypothetical protein